jgi:hypothetical protein
MYLDVLIPTCDRPAELAVTLAGLAAENDCSGSPGEAPGAGMVGDGFGVTIADQSGGGPVWEHGAVAGMVRVLRHRGHPVSLHRNLPRRGIAQQRAYLLDRSRARYVLFLDDDVWLEPGSVRRMLTAIEDLRCGFVGNFPHGLSYVDDHRPEQEKAYEEWTDRPHPERIRPRGRHWRRANLHAAAQLRVLGRAGGAGILPSGAYHLESPTTLPDRGMECFDEPLYAQQLGAVALPEGEQLPGRVDDLADRDLGDERG